MATLKARDARTAYHTRTGQMAFVGTPHGGAMAVPGANPSGPPRESALAVARAFGPLFGLESPEQNLLPLNESRNATGGPTVRFQQTHFGIPVIAGELIVAMDANHDLVAMTGEIAPLPDGLAAQARVSSDQARDTALSAVAKWYEVVKGELVASPPILSFYDPRLLEPGSAPVKLVWRVDVRPNAPNPIRELVLVDALRGHIALHFNQIHRAKSRQTHDSGGTSTLPGALVCDESSGDACTGGVNTEADFAHRYAGHTYDFYLTQHGRDSLDGNAMTLISSVNWNDGFSCPNAFWDGAQVVYCNGLASGDDVVAHELTHGVTATTSQLFYYYQSGAINESLSDVWGEFVDLTNGSGSDSPADRWKMGEDTVSGVIRDMADPTLYSHPDRVTSPFYDFDPNMLDGGGVHSNSGINNKAAYLMVDGGSFNGHTVTALGITKVAAIYYEAQTNLLVSGSDYADLYHALDQACTNLIGTAGITASDCTQVHEATDAVEMSLEPVAGFNPDATVCPGSQVPVLAFYDDMENGTARWTLTHDTSLAGSDWVQWFATYGSTGDGPYAVSGTESLFGGNDAIRTDMRAEITVAVPPSQAYLHFDHAFGFEYSGSTYYDGGVLEYSTNGGSSWTDAAGLIDSGKSYGGTIQSAYSNPLGGRSAYVADSHGYVSTRLNLGSLSGQSVHFRWRVGTDEVMAAVGWFLDDVMVYVCAASNAPPTADAGADKVVLPGSSVTLSGSGTDDSGAIADYAWTQTAGSAVTLSSATVATPSFTAPASSGTLTFQLTVTDFNDATGTDTVNVIVNMPPTANAGADLMVAPSTGVTLSGGGNDTDGTVVGYLWSQTAGTTVALTAGSTAAPTFTAPPTAETLSFQLTVTDDAGATGTDAVNVVVNPPPVASAGPDLVVAPNALVTISGIGSDSNGTVVGYAWTQTAGTTQALTGANSPTATFTAPNASSTLTFQLVVTDNQGSTGTDTANVIVNVPPAADAGADVIVAPGDPAGLRGGGSDADGTIVGYLWSQTAGTPVALSEGNSSAATFTAPDSTGTLAFQLTVTDNHGTTSTDSVDVKVIPPTLGLAAERIDFGLVTVGSTAVQSVVLTNAGGGTLEVSTSAMRDTPMARFISAEPAEPILLRTAETRELVLRLDARADLLSDARGEVSDILNPPPEGFRVESMLALETNDPERTRSELPMEAAIQPSSGLACACSTFGASAGAGGWSGWLVFLAIAAFNRLSRRFSRLEER